MNAQNPNLSPDFVHARSVQPVHPPVMLLTFPEGFECYTHSSVEETEFIYNEIFVKQEYLRHGLTLEEVSCLFDVGANIGLFTLFAKTKNPRVVIHAFEPIPETYDVLRLNVELHHLTDVYTYPLAIGSQPAEQRTFTYYPHMAGNSTATPAIKRNQLQLMEQEIGKGLTDFLFQSETRSATVESLSSFLGKHEIPMIDLLKIDVEGDELAVLQGIDKGDIPRFRKLILETHTPQIAQEVCAMLTRMGYKVFSDVGLSSLPEVSDIYAIAAG